MVVTAMTVQHTSRTLPFNVLCKYPFLNASMAWVQEKNVMPITAFYSHVEMVDNIRAILADALANKEQTKAMGYSNDGSLYLYPWIRIVLAFMNMPRLTYKVANLLSKHFSALLDREDDTTVISVARDQGINAERVPVEKSLSVNTVSFPYRLPFLEYLDISARFKSQAWKLVNKLLLGGHVYLRKHDLVRMLEELVKMKISETGQAAHDDALKSAFMEDPMLKPFYDGLVTMVKDGLSSSTGSMDTLPVDDSAFPPCINAILDKNAKGVNLSHTERLFLVYFLLTIGKTVDEVLDLFRNQPDYNEKITKYQVEFAAGKHGKQTQYKPHNCVTLESISVCKKNDSIYGSNLCINPKTPFKNPLTLYRRKVWAKSRGLPASVGTSSAAASTPNPVPEEEPVDTPDAGPEKDGGQPST
jgi:DNA primase large subunit